jgi:hypothetical protein
MMAIDREEIRAWVEVSCFQQGVPFRVVDSGALAKVRVLFLGGLPEGRARVRGVLRAAPKSKPPVGLDPGQVVA